jgi:hypothetical protein
MKKIGLIVSLLACGWLMSSCTTTSTPAANAGNTAAGNSAANTAAKPAAQPATMDAIAALEKQGWEGWKNHDAKAYNDLLSDRYVGFGKDGRQDKAEYVASMSKAKYDVKSYSWSDEKLTNLSPDVAILTFKATQDYMQDGKKGTSPTYCATVYVREGASWKNILYMENPVIDPKSPPKSYAAPAAAKADDAKPDAATDQLMAIEKKAWEAWKQRDKAGVESVMAANFMYDGATGPDDRATMIKRWGEEKCEGLDYTLANGKGFAVTPDVMLVTYRADVKGKCNGNPIPPSMWVASFDTKEGNDWKNAFYIDVPRQ